MSRAARLHRHEGMVRLFPVLLALGLVVNGTWMFLSPDTWYATVPGVVDTGPLNPHFVRDIGGAYLASGVAFAWFAFARPLARPAALVGATFLILHAIVHLWDVIAGRESVHHAATDLPTILLPALLSLWLVRMAAPSVVGEHRPPPTTRSDHRKPRGLVARLAAPAIATYERDFGYDTTYMREIARISGSGILRFGLFSTFVMHREDTPADAWFAAKITAVIREDCGPCTQLGVRMAEREGVDAKVLRAIVEGDERAMSEGAALAFAFTNAVLDRDLEASERLRREIVDRWGERALVTLAFAISSVRVFPTVKYALGHARACSRVSIDGQMIPVRATAHLTSVSS